MNELIFFTFSHQSHYLRRAGAISGNPNSTSLKSELNTRKQHKYGRREKSNSQVDLLLQDIRLDSHGETSVESHGVDVGIRRKRLQRSPKEKKSFQPRNDLAMVEFRNLLKFCDRSVVALNENNNYLLLCILNHILLALTVFL